MECLLTLIAQLEIDYNNDKIPKPSTDYVTLFVIQVLTYNGNQQSHLSSHHNIMQLDKNINQTNICLKCVLLVLDHEARVMYLVPCDFILAIKNGNPHANTSTSLSTTICPLYLPVTQPLY